MQRFYIKKTIFAMVVLILITVFAVQPVMASQIGAEGGKNSLLPAGVYRSEAALTLLFGEHATWKYYDKGKLPADNWSQPSFNDGSWSAASALLGYGNDNERTVISFGSDPSNKYISTYFRKTFPITNAATILKMSMTMFFDDGAVVYLNGKEIYRVNMPTGTVGYSTLASKAIELSTTTVSIPPALFVNGNNIIAVEIHQCGKTSSDISFSLILNAEFGTPAPTSTPTRAPTSTAVPPTATPIIPTAVPPTATPIIPTVVLAPPNPTTAATPTVAATAQPTQPPTSGNAFYVATNGSSSNDGSASHPWSLQHALSQPSALRPGAVVWVRGGTYSGSFTVSLKGSSTAPITIRAYPGERVTLTNSSSYNMDIQESYYVNFWGLEITQNYSNRSTSRPESTYGIRVNQGFSSHHIKFINMIVHDVQAQGIGWWQAMSDSEIYGSLFYFNGTTELDHGVYVNNKDGTKWFIDNIVNDNASHGYHGYIGTTTKSGDNLYLEGNTFFNNGSVGYNTSAGKYGIYKRNILIGGVVIVRNTFVSNNYTYYPGDTGSSFNLGYNTGFSGATITNNYFMGGQFVLGGSKSGLVMSGNSVYAPGGFSGFTTSSYSNNSWMGSKPSGVRFFVRPNKYEGNRANITIFNWAKQNSVSIPASNLNGIRLSSGDRYELHNAQNFYGDVITGVYDGSSINVPMTGRSVAQPTGLSFKPPSSFPEFGSFVLIVPGR